MRALILNEASASLECGVFHKCLCENLACGLLVLKGLRVVGYTQELILAPLEDVVANILEGI